MIAQTEDCWRIVINQSKLEELITRLRAESELKAELLERFCEEFLFRKTYSTKSLHDLTDFWACLCVKHGLTQMAKAQELKIRTNDDSGNITFAHRSTIGSVKKIPRR